MHKKTIPALLLSLAVVALTACGGSEAPATSAATAPATTPAAAPTPTPAAEPAAAPAEAASVAIDANAVDGKSVYGKTCALCHASGLAGAPMPGNKDDWAPRNAQGRDTLYKHALEGFTGEKGLMPAKGGNANLSDEEVKAAVDYMADQVG